jgi:hypothetical protein
MRALIGRGNVGRPWRAGVGLVHLGRDRGDLPWSERELLSGEAVVEYPLGRAQLVGPGPCR